MGDEVCAVCMESLVDAPCAPMPGCGHRLHVACLINNAQYDVRCPVCRRTGEGIVARQRDTIVHIEWTDLHTEIEHAQQTAMAEWRRYTARRRRVLRQRPHLAERVAKLRELRAAMVREYEASQRVYDERCRHIWREDPEVRHHRRALTLLRRRERRLDQMLERELETLLGPEPQ